MGNYASKLLAIAKQEVGYLEKKSNSQLDDKTANAGSNNYTKYSRDLVKWIGSPYAQGVAWCDMFVDWCFITSFGKDEAKKLLGNWSAYTPTSADYYKKMNRWGTTPKIGAQIFFKNSTRICHTGIVTKVDNQYVYTIEGNTSGGSGVVANGGGVFEKKYALNNSKIAGYGYPAYDTESSATTPSSPTKIMNGIDISHWQDGIDIKKIQADFVICKASQGTSFKDECLDKFAKQVLGSGKLLGVYHFADGKSSGKAEAEWFLKCVAPYVGKAVLILDWEANALKKNTNYALEFMRTVKKNANATPVLYCSTNVTREKDWTVFIKEFPMLWGAKHGDDPKRTKYVTERINDGEDLRGFSEIMRQYSSNTFLSGYNSNLDANIFYGEKKDWVWLSNGTVEQSSSTPKSTSPESVSANSSSPQTTQQKTTTSDASFKPYKVKVTASALYVRSSPGKNYSAMTIIRDQGVYTIVDEKMNGSTKWGLLESYKKNRNGWISLAYTKRI